MFNLLPDSLKEDIKKDYKIRRLIVILVAVFFIQIFFLILLLPSWLVSEWKEKDAITETESMTQSSLASSTNSVVGAIRTTSIKLKVINSVLEYPKVVPYVDAIIAQKTSSIHVDELTYSLVDAQTATIAVSGVAATREALVAFQKSLEETGLFKAVNLPVSNLTKDKDITFSLDITVAQ